MVCPSDCIYSCFRPKALHLHSLNDSRHQLNNETDWDFLWFTGYFSFCWVHGEAVWVGEGFELYFTPFLVVPYWTVFAQWALVTQHILSHACNILSWMFFLCVFCCWCMSVFVFLHVRLLTTGADWQVAGEGSVLLEQNYCHQRNPPWRKIFIWAGSWTSGSFSSVLRSMQLTLAPQIHQIPHAQRWCVPHSWRPLRWLYESKGNSKPLPSMLYDPQDLYMLTTVQVQLTEALVCPLRSRRTRSSFHDSPTDTPTPNN